MRATQETQTHPATRWPAFTPLPGPSPTTADRASDLVQSLLDDYRQSGWLPKWSFANQNTEVMTGDPADPTIAGAYAMGARNFDTDLALQAMVHGATAVGVDAGDRYVERP